MNDVHVAQACGTLMGLGVSPLSQSPQGPPLFEGKLDSARGRHTRCLGPPSRRMVQVSRLRVRLHCCTGAWAASQGDALATGDASPEWSEVLMPQERETRIFM